jgi:hypothetical protein
MDRLPQDWEGGSNTFKIGSLKRRLPAVVLATLNSSQTSSLGTINQHIVLKNLSGSLKCQIMGSFSSIDGKPAIVPASIPAGAVTMQLTPVVLTPNAGKIYGRPTFQDPTALANQNHPLPQDLPFGWEFSTESDEVYIDVVIADVFGGLALDGQIVIAASVEYNGDWWSVEAIKYALSRVQLTGANPPQIGTAGG